MELVQSDPLLLISLVPSEALFTALILAYLDGLIRIMKSKGLFALRIFLNTLLFMAGFFSLSYFLPPATEYPGVRFVPANSKDVIYQNGSIGVLKFSTDAGKEYWYFHGAGENDYFESVQQVLPAGQTGALLVPEKAETLLFDSEKSNTKIKLFSGLDLLSWERSILKSNSSKSLLDTIIQALAWGILFSSFWLYARISKWPLFNSLILGFAAFLSVFLISYIYGDQFTKLIQIIPEPLLTYVPQFIITLAALLHYLLFIFLPPLKNWRREFSE